MKTFNGEAAEQLYEATSRSRINVCYNVTALCSECMIYMLWMYDVAD